MRVRGRRRGAAGQRTPTGMRARGWRRGAREGEVAMVRDRGAVAGVRAREGGGVCTRGRLRGTRQRGDGGGARQSTAAVVRAMGRRWGFGAPVAAVAHKKYFVLPLMTDIPAIWIFDHSGIPHKPFNQVDNIFIYINIPSQALILPFKNVVP